MSWEDNLYAGLQTSLAKNNKDFEVCEKIK